MLTVVQSRQSLGPDCQLSDTGLLGGAKLARDGDYLNSRQVAGWLGISLRTLVNLRGRQVLPHVKLGRVVRYRRDAVESALKAYSIGRHFQAGETRTVIEYTHHMRRRSKSWPRLYTQVYRTGAVKYGADLGCQGKKKRDRRLLRHEGEAGSVRAASACGM